ncbi:MAG: hypothetical protein CL916_10065, partial [Deltaproteobacteria bacterium]|nr:hypothetical protein [Deltaproteobacteria bacterium]
NRTPDTPTLFITPTNPTEGVDNLTCQMSTPTDPDGNGQTLVESYEWESSDGTLVSGDTVLAQETSAGDTWTCYGTVSDGIDTVEISESVSIASEGCPEASTAQTTEGHEYLGYCWYLTLPNGTCDATCGSVSGGSNLMTEAQSSITSTQMNYSSAVQSAMHLFYVNGNPGNFTGTGGGSWPGLGYAYYNGTYYHRVNGTNSAAFPGNTRGTDSDRMFACACIHSN